MAKAKPAPSLRALYNQVTELPREWPWDGPHSDWPQMTYPFTYFLSDSQ